MLKEALIRHCPPPAMARLRSWKLALRLRTILVVGGVLRRLPGTSRRFGPPRRIGATLAGYLAAHPAAAARGDAAFVPIEEPRSPHPLGIAIVRRGRVLTDGGKVILPDDELIEEVSSDFLARDPRANTVFTRLRLPRVRSLRERVAVLTMSWSGNYYHWLFHTLPRLKLLEASGVAWDRIVAPRGQRFQRESLDLVGIAASRIIAEPNLHLEADTLVVPTLVDAPGDPRPWVSQFLRERLLAPAGSGGARRRIYISREKRDRRRVVNEAELAAALETEGFERFSLEDLSLLDQIALFRDADMVVGPHGSGLANLIFCGPETRVVELFGPDYINHCYRALAHRLGLDYRPLVGIDPRGRRPAAGMPGGENIVVAVTTLRAALHAL